MGRCVGKCVGRCVGRQQVCTASGQQLRMHVLSSGCVQDVSMYMCASKSVHLVLSLCGKYAGVCVGRCVDAG